MASGTGSNLQAILDASASGDLPVEVVAVISDRDNAYALKRAADVPANHRYPESDGLPELRRAIAAWYQRRHQVTLDPDKEVVPLIGSKEGIGHLPLCLVDPGDVVLITDPGYPVYEVGTMFVGGDGAWSSVAASTEVTWSTSDRIGTFASAENPAGVNLIPNTEPLPVSSATKRCVPGPWTSQRFCSNETFTQGLGRISCS